MGPDEGTAAAYGRGALPLVAGSAPGLIGGSLACPEAAQKRMPVQVGDPKPLKCIEVL